jgi:NTP pyrophosphatase (non-canonical NTP hydrolase)
MQGFFANPTFKTDVGEQRTAEICYEVADAMLKARQQ